MKTHRCEGSLGNYISIRYGKQYKNIIQEDDIETWRLFENTYDWEYGSHYQHCIAEIKYCPFCGEELKGD